MIRGPTTLPQALAVIEELRADLGDALRALGRLRADDETAAIRALWSLTAMEADVVLILYKRRGAVCSKGYLMDALYDQNPDEPDAKIIDVMICKIRAKMSRRPMGGPAHGWRGAPQTMIATMWGMGYSATPRLVAQLDTVARQPAAAA